MESKTLEVLIIIIGLVLLYFILNKLLDFLNKKAKMPYSPKDKELQGFGLWREKSIFFAIVLICLIAFIIAIIKSLL